MITHSQSMRANTSQVANGKQLELPVPQKNGVRAARLHPSATGSVNGVVFNQNEVSLRLVLPAKCRGTLAVLT